MPKVGWHGIDDVITPINGNTASTNHTCAYTYRCVKQLTARFFFSPRNASNFNEQHNRLFAITRASKGMDDITIQLDIGRPTVALGTSQTPRIDQPHAGSIMRQYSFPPYEA